MWTCRLEQAGRQRRQSHALNNVAFFSLAAISWQTLGQGSEVLGPVGLTGPTPNSESGTQCGGGDVHHLALKSSQSWRVNDIGRLCGDVEGRHVEQTPGSQSSLVP